MKVGVRQFIKNRGWSEDCRLNGDSPSVLPNAGSLGTPRGKDFLKNLSSMTERWIDADIWGSPKLYTHDFLVTQ